MMGRDSFFRSIVESASDGVVVSGRDERITYANPMMHRMLGYAEGELQGMSLGQIIHHDDLRDNPLLTERILSGETIVKERALLRKDGSTLRVEVRAALSADGDVLAVVRDLSEMRRLEGKYRHVVHGSMEGFCLFGTNGIIMDANSAYAGMLGYAVDELIGMHVGMIEAVESPEETARHIEAVMRDGQDRFETRQRRMDGFLIDVEISMKYVSPEELGEPGFYVFIRDMTEANRQKREELRSQRLESLSALSGAIAHEFNNLLTVIMSNLELASMRLVGDAVEPNVLRAAEAAKRGRDLVQSLSYLSEAGESTSRRICLGKLARETAAHFNVLLQESVVIEALPADDTYVVLAEPGRLQQALMDIYKNAVESIVTARIDGKSCEGRVHVKVDNVSMPQVLKRGGAEVSPGDYVRLVVSDDGHGMDRATLARAFEPFFTTRGDAQRGMGLSTAYGIVKSHGGWIEAESVPGEGSGFKVYLPHAHAAEQPPGTARTRPEMVGGSETVLLVDDEQEVLDTVREMLENLGYTVIATTSQREAVELFTLNTGSIDLVISDFVMPGMSGFELLRSLRQLRPGMKALILSGNVGRASHGIVFNDTGVAFLAKPFELGDLAASVRGCLGETGGGSTLRREISKVRLSYMPEATAPYEGSITKPETVYGMFRHLADEPREKFLVLLLDVQKRLLAYDEITQGTLDKAVVYPQEVLKAALLTNAPCIILVHNHPSGETAPSKEDIDLTSEIIEACGMFDVKLLDHIIIGRNGFYSFSNPDK